MSTITVNTKELLPVRRDGQIGGAVTIINSSGGGVTSATGEPALGNPSVTGYVLSSTTAGVRSWVAQSGGSVTPAALTKVDDTNVTLTLGGTPATALLQGTSLTLGWTGTLADGRIASATSWNTAYTDRLKWDGGSTGLTAATGRTSLGATTLGGNIFQSTSISAVSFMKANANDSVVYESAATHRGSLGGSTVGQSFFTLTNPTAITFPRINADNTVTALTAAQMATAIGGEPALGNPAVSGYVLSSLMNGTRSWIAVSGSMTYPAAGIAVSTGAAWGTSLTDASANWNTAYTDRLKWDGGSTGLTAATGRTSLGGTTVGQNMFTLTNPSAITFPKITATNTVVAESAATYRTSLGVEAALGNPASTGYVLSSTSAGARSWIAPSTSTIPNAHQNVVGATDLTVAVAYATISTVTYTPVGSKALISFSAPFKVTTPTQTVYFRIYINSVLVRTVKVIIYSGTVVIAFQWLGAVNAGSGNTIRIDWGGSGGTAIQQNGSTDSDRVMSIVDLA